MKRLVLLCLCAAALGCNSTLEPIPARVDRFVSEEALPSPRGIVPILRVPEQDLLVFRVSYGPPMDCPSGCFYSVAYGLKLGEKIGWMRLVYADADTALRERLRFFDPAPSDEYLFSEALFARFAAQDDPSDRGQLDSYAYHRAFQPLLAADADTPADALLRLAHLLYTTYNPEVGQLLLDNPSVQQNRAILEVLANLPVEQGGTFYQAIRDRARELLQRLPAAGAVNQ